MDKVTKLFDCHSHWGTKRGYLFRTEAELAQQEKIWKTKATFWSEDEMADYFRQNNVRTILDLSFTKFLPIEEIRAHHDYAFEFQRKHPDVVFGHWLQFDPRRALEAIREFDRALARRRRLRRLVRQRPGARHSSERSLLGPALSARDRGRPPDHDPHRSHRDRAGTARRQGHRARPRPSPPHRCGGGALSATAHSRGAARLSVAG